MNELGEYLKELRGKRSLREMERVTGLSHTYLSSLEKGADPRSGKVRKPSPEMLKTLSNALDVDYHELMVKAGYIQSFGEYLIDQIVLEFDESIVSDMQTLAKKLGLSYESTIEILSNKRRPTDNEIIQITNSLPNVSPVEVASRAGYDKAEAYIKFSSNGQELLSFKVDEKLNNLNAERIKELFNNTEELCAHSLSLEEKTKELFPNGIALNVLLDAIKRNYKKDTVINSNKINELIIHISKAIKESN